MLIWTIILIGIVIICCINGVIRCLENVNATLERIEGKISRITLEPIVEPGRSDWANN